MQVELSFLSRRLRQIGVAGAAIALPALTLTGPATATAQPTAPAASTAPTARSGVSFPALRTYKQRIPVNVVLVGYDKAEVGGDIVAGLSASSKPVVRYPRFYGLQGRNMGLRFNYDYNVIDTSKRFEDRFFGFLTRTGVPGDPTLYQQQYNAQNNNVLNIKGPVLTIDAPSTEAWLEQRAQRQLGIGRKSYTVFLVNWWGRDDFAFHVYRKTDTVDPDTGYNFGTQRESRAMIAWGGSSGRSWFYDLSAGPEAWTSNWNVDDADVDGDGVADYRIPPIWEYSRNGYRSRYRLGSDLSKVVRYVAVNLLFTSSPLYDPMNTAPAPGGKLRVPVTMFEDNPDSSGLKWFKASDSVSRWRQLEPYIRVTTSVNDVNPIDQGAKKAFRIFAGLWAGKGECWQQFGDTFAQPYCYFAANSGRYYRDVPRDYEIGTFAFWTTPFRMGDQAGLLGYADDNWVDGTQTFMFAFDDPSTIDLGYGFTTTITHEVGHNLGMSHPHDGYDPQTGVDYDATGDYYFVWAGDESNTIMSYNALANGFGRFDKDNMARYQFAGYANWMKSLLSGVSDVTSLTPRQQTALGKARTLLRDATKNFRRWQYVRAAQGARDGWEIVQRIAKRLGVDDRFAAALLRSTPTSSVPREGDPIRFPNT